MDYDKVLVNTLDAVYYEITCENAIAFELNEYFSFYVPGYNFMPKYKDRIWDGKKYLFNVARRTLYRGLKPYLIKFCEDRNYSLVFLNEHKLDAPFSTNDGHAFVSSEKLDKFEIRDYQVDTFVRAVNDKRGVYVCPTASGKSFIIYLITKYINTKTLIIVPTVALVHQMTDDFADYGLNVDKHVHKIFSGQDKNTKKKIVISTWQSLQYIKDRDFFEQFEMVIGDEAHTCKSKQISSILEKMTFAEHRFGFTGTLDGTETHKFVLEGLFGTSHEIISTAELMEKKILAELKIKTIILNHNDNDRKFCKKMKYADEMSFISTSEKRNRFIRDLVLSLKGNTLVLYQYVDKQGKPLYNMIKEKSKDPVYFIDGSVKGEVRNDFRKEINKSLNTITVASYGTTSTGINVPNIDNVVFASPYKSRIKVLQSIGRGLRRSDKKEKCVLYDLVDDLQWKSRVNHVMNHYMERQQIYIEQGFNYKVYRVKI